MKKLISLILTVCMACMLIPAMAESASAAGVWYLQEMTNNGVTMAAGDTGIVWTLTLGEDGTAVSAMTMMGETQEQSGTWTQDGDKVTVTIEDSPVDGTLADGKLTLAMGDQAAVFGPDAPEASTKPAAVAADSEDVFLGDWELTAVEMMGVDWEMNAVEMMGVYMSKELLASSSASLEGFDVKLHIEPGKVAVISKTSAEAQEESTEMTSTFADGKLNVEIDLGEAATTAESAGLDVSGIIENNSTIELLEDGGLLYGMKMFGMEIDVYLVKVDAAAEEPAA